jgi:hypothetical protein
MCHDNDNKKNDDDKLITPIKDKRVKQIPHFAT